MPETVTIETGIVIRYVSGPATTYPGPDVILTKVSSRQPGEGYISLNVLRRRGQRYRELSPIWIGPALPGSSCRPSAPRFHFAKAAKAGSDQLSGKDQVTGGGMFRKKL